MAPTVGYANNGTVMYKSKFGRPFVGTDELKKSSSTAEAKRATQSAHTDQAIHAAVRRFIPPIPRLCCLAPSVTTPLYSTTVCQALRQTLRGEGPEEYPPAPATHEDTGVAPRMWRWGIQGFSLISVSMVNTPLRDTRIHSKGLRHPLKVCRTLCLESGVLDLWSGHARLLPCLWCEPKGVLRYLGDGGDRGGGGATHGGSDAREPIWRRSRRTP